MEGHSADRATDAARDAYRTAGALMRTNHKRKRDERIDLRGQKIVPRCGLTAKPVVPQHIAVQRDDQWALKAKHKPVVAQTIFSDIPSAQFGEVWTAASRPHLCHLLELFQDLLTSVDSNLPTITCLLATDHDVIPSHNRGHCTVAEIETRLENPAAWGDLVRRLRTDFAYQEVVSGLVSKAFGMRLTFHRVELVAFEVYTWAWPWAISVQAQSYGASVETMTLVPHDLVAAVSPSNKALRIKGTVGSLCSEVADDTPA